LVPVRRVERVGNLLNDRHGTNGLQSTLVLAHKLSQVRTFHVVHGDEENAVRVAGAVDGDDVRMVERSSESRLPQEALAEPLVLRKVPGERLESNLAAELDLLRQIDLTHPAAGEQPIESVTGYPQPSSLSLDTSMVRR
jgi:hypothetical protein